VIQQIRDIAAQLESVYRTDEAEALAWWIMEEKTGLSRSQILIGCKGTTNFPKLQDFCDKNDLCLHKNLFIAQKDCSSQDNANVASGEDVNQAESEDTKILQAIIDRLLHFEPIQYIFGHTLWNGLDLLVTPATLIPRPETAELVERVNEKMVNEKMIKCLDVGTGSGCIAIALKKAHPEWQITGIDISEEAIKVARENAKRNNVEIDFIKKDIFAGFNGDFDIVVSNPPYICESEKTSMRKNVLDYEPSTALFVPDADPLRFYRRIAELKLGKYLFFEINEAYPAELSAMLDSLGYTDIHLTRDIYGKPRIIEARMA
jgi:release factor glutamine methyltransferase